MFVKASWIKVAALGVLLALQGAARAESAEALYKKGVELRRAGNDDAALEVFKQLNEMEHSPRSLAQLGLAEQAVGLWVDAEAHVQEAVKAASNPWIRKNHDSLAAALDRIQDRLGWVEIRGEPADAEVLIDGKRVGTLPLAAPVRVVVGSIPVTVRAPDYIERSTTITVAPKTTARERFVLQHVDTPPPRVATAAGDRPSTSTPVLVASGAGDSGAGAEPGRLRRSAKWIAFGAGAAALGAGVFGLVRQTQSGSDFDSGCGLNTSGVATAEPGSGKTDAQCASFKNTTDSAFRLEVTGFSAAGALAALGLVFWLTEPTRGAEGSATASLRCAPGLGASGPAAASLACALRF